MSARRSDTDEEVALVDVDNAAVGSMFSPTMWVRRPSRIDPREIQGAAPSLTNENPVENPTFVSNQDRNDASHPLKDTSNMMQQPRRNTNGKRSADADLDILDDLDKEGTEQEQTEQDLLHIAQLEAELLRAKDQCRTLERRLQEVSADATEVITQNQHIKRLFAAAGVARDDFNFEGIFDGPARKKRMLSTGNRLIRNLYGYQKSPVNVIGDASNTHGVQGEGFHLSGGGGRALQNGETPAPYVPHTKPEVTPPSAYPIESQIAAASLTLADGNPAGALLSILEKALGGREPPQQQQQVRQQGQRIPQQLPGTVAV